MCASDPFDEQYSVVVEIDTITHLREYIKTIISAPNPRLFFISKNGRFEIKDDDFFTDIVFDHHIINILVQ